MARIEDTISGLEARLKKARAQKQAQEARQRAAAVKKARSQDTRRKILAGAVVLAAVDSGKMQEPFLRQLLDATLTRDDDRLLFALPPLTQTQIEGSENFTP